MRSCFCKAERPGTRPTLYRQQKTSSGLGTEAEPPNTGITLALSPPSRRPLVPFRATAARSKAARHLPRRRQPYKLHAQTPLLLRTAAPVPNLVNLPLRRWPISVATRKAAEFSRRPPLGQPAIHPRAFSTAKPTITSNFQWASFGG